MLNTSIVKYESAQPLTDPTALTRLAPEVYYQIGCAFPDPEMNEEQRVTRAMGRCGETASYAMTAKNRADLTRCCYESWVDVITGIVSVDLPVVRSLGYVALIPYSGILTLMLQYQGLGELILRGNTVSSLQSYLVYKGDEFTPIYGSEPKVIHIPDMTRKHRIEDMTHAYTIAHHLNGPVQIEVMDRDELETVRKASKMPDGPAWKYYPAEMYRKAPTRRIAKRIKKQVGGVAQTAINRGLTLEDSQFDHSRLDRYKELIDKRTEDETTDAREATRRRPEAIETIQRPDGWVEASTQTVKTLWAEIKKLRQGSGSSLTDKEWAEQVLYSMNAAGEITTSANLHVMSDFIKAWDMIVNEKRFTWDTGELIPDDI